MASDNYMFRRIMVVIIRLCSYKGELNTIASSKWLKSYATFLGFPTVQRAIQSA